MLESLKCEVIDLYWLGVYPSCVRWWLSWLCIASSERLYWLERGVVYSLVVLPQILSGGSPCGKSCVDEIVEILLCEGGDVEQWLEPRNKLLVFVIDPLSLTLSLYFVHWFILPYHIHAWFVCVPHLCLTKRASYSTSTLIQRNSEELVQSPSPGIRLHSLVTLSVLQLSFNFRIIVHRLVVHLFTPPLGVLSIGIRAYAPDIRFNHLEVRS